MATNTARQRATTLYGQRIACSARDGRVGNSCTPYRKVGCLYGRIRQRESTGVSVARPPKDLDSRGPVILGACELRRYLRKRGPPLWKIWRGASCLLR